MGKFITGLILFFFGIVAFAGFRGETVSSNLGLLNVISCSTGISCTKSGAKMVVANDNTFLGAGTGTISGYLQKQVAATATTITVAQCGSTFVNSGAVVINLPALATAVIGCRVTFVTMNASNFDVNPTGTNRILVSTDANGDAIRNATLGNSITLEAVSATQWAPISIQGTYTDIN